MVNKANILHQVRKGLEAQFDGPYNWDNMINDLDLTKEEKNWAKEHTTYDVKIVE